MVDILSPVITLGGLGAVFGVGLSLASKAFAVEIDPKVDKIRELLPGANCGACGYPGCDGLAEAIAAGEAPVTACSVGGKPVADKIADSLGVNAGEMTKMVAKVKCNGDCDKSKDKYAYKGINDCRAQNILSGGSKACSYGCLGCGTCVEVCDFDALKIVNGIAVVDKEKCTSCQACMPVCPKGLIDLVPYEKDVAILCNSKDKGKAVKISCDVGCIGCGICAKNCPKEAITIENNLAVIDYDKCINCGICAKKCPTGAIEFTK